MFSNSFADVDGFGFTIDSGDPVINSPEHQFNIQASKGLTIANKPARIGGGLFYTDERNGFVGSDFTLPSYTTVRLFGDCLLYTSPSPRDLSTSRMPSSA